MESNDDTIQSILSGSLNHLPPKRSQVVRAFISSTFTDTKLERNAIMKDVYSRLKDYCRSRHGLDFQLVDMRWGVRDEATDDHITTELCLKEIELCQKISVGPNFVSIIGQKYGYRPFPTRIPIEHFDSLRQCMLLHHQSVELIDDWFRKDENAQPPVYILQPISSRLHHYNDPSEPELQAKDRQMWWDIYSQLRSSLASAAKKLRIIGKLDKKVADLFQISVTHQEIAKGILDVENNPSDQCVCFVRKISNLQEDLSNEHAPAYIDFIQGQNEIDTEAVDMLSSLLNEQIKDKLNESQIFESRLDWSPMGIDPDGDDNHLEYIKRFCEKFYLVMIKMIDKGVEKIQQALIEDSLYEEVLGHLVFCRQQCQSFHGRRESLQIIENYIDQSANQDQSQQKIKKSPLVVYGQSGSGKTCMMAKCAQYTKETYPDCNVMVRFLGTSPDSSSIRKLLASLCIQLSRLYDQDLNQIPNEYSQLIAYFATLIHRIPHDKPLVIILDSLDQLLPSDGAHRMSWIPRVLPSHVCILLSTLPMQYNCLTTLQSVLPHDSQYIEIEALPVDVGQEIITDWLESNSRKINTQQSNIVHQAVQHCSLPLYLKLIHDQALTWHSYDKIKQRQIPITIPLMIHALFDRLERIHGKVVVSRALAYITATKSGLTEPELEDLLSCDDLVLQDVYQYWLPPVRRIPPLLWTRIRNDINEYLVEREADGNQVIFWYHRQFTQVAYERYLGDEELKQQIHSQCADYYLGKWAGICKPFEYTSKQVELFELDNQYGEADRKVPKQPLIFEFEGELYTNKRKYNKRKLSELPYHLIFADRIQEAKKIVFCSYNWLLTKLKATSIQEVLNDFILAMEYQQDIELKIVYDMIRMSASTIIHNPYDLAPEIVGQLYDLTKSQYPCVQELVNTARSEGIKSAPLMPVRGCLPLPGGPLRSTLEGHTDEVISLAVSSNGIFLATGSADKSVRIWNLNSGSLVHILKGHTEPIHRVHISQDNRMVIAYSYIGQHMKVKSIVVWNLESGQHMYNLKGHTGGHCPLVLTHDSQYAFSACHYRWKLCQMLSIPDVANGDDPSDDSDENSHKNSDENKTTVNNGVNNTNNVDDDVSNDVNNDVNNDVSNDSNNDDVSENEQTQITNDESESRDIQLNHQSTKESNGDHIVNNINQLIDDDYTQPDKHQKSYYKSKLMVILKWNLETGQLIDWMEGHTDDVEDIVIASDDSFIVTCSRDKTSKIWCLKTRTCLRTIVEPKFKGIMSRLCLTSDNRYIIIEALHLGVYCVQSGDLLYELVDPKYSASIESFSLSQDNQFLLLTDVGNHIKCFNIHNGQFINRIDESGDGKSNMRYGGILPGGQYAAVTLGTKQAKIWDMHKGDLVATLTGHTDRIVASLILSHVDESLLVTVSKDHTAKIWDLSNLNSIHDQKSTDFHQSSVNFIEIAQDGSYFITGSQDKKLKKWDIETGELLQELDVSIGVIYRLYTMPDGKTSYAFPFQKSTRITLDLDELKIIDTDQLKFTHIMTACLSFDGRHLMGVTYDQVLKVWDTNDFSIVSEIKKPRVTKIKSLKSNYFLTIYQSKFFDKNGDTKIIKAWNFNKNGQTIKLTGHSGRIQCYALTDDERYLLTGANDNTIIIWNLSNLTIYGKLLGHAESIQSVAVAAKARIAVSGSKDTTVRLWDFSSNICRLIHTYQGHQHVVDYVTFSLNNSYIISFSSEETVVKVWSVATENLMADFHMHAKMHTYEINEINCKLVIGTNDGRVILLNIYEVIRKRAGTKVVGWEDLKAKSRSRAKFKPDDEEKSNENISGENHNNHSEQDEEVSETESRPRSDSKSSNGSTQSILPKPGNNNTQPPQTPPCIPLEVQTSTCCTIS